MAKSILVVDDDVAIVEALVELFGDEGWRVRTSLGDDVPAVVQRNRPDLVLLDIWMSGHDGGDICCRLKTDVKTATTPIILMSANHSVEDIACNCGANDFISKPFDIEALLGKVERLTGGGNVA